MRDFLFAMTCIAAFSLGQGCATFRGAAADIPGSVQVGLSITACVAMAVKQNPEDVAAREDAIRRCVADAINALPPAQRKTLLEAPK